MILHAIHTIHAITVVVFSGVQFDTTISVGNILTVLSVLGVGTMFCVRVSYRVESIEKWIVIHQKEVDIREQLAQELKTGVALLNQSMTDLARRLTDQEFSANRERRNNRNSKAS